VRYRWTGVTLAAVAVAAIAAGCSGKSDSPNATVSGTPGAQAYLTCLSEHGVTGLPSFGASGRPTGRPSARASGAQGAGNGQGARPSGSPGGERPSGSRGPGGGGFPGGINTKPSGVDQTVWDTAVQACAPLRPSRAAGGNGNGAANSAYRTCLADHGVAASNGPNGLNTADPTVAGALKICEPLRPSGRPTPPAPSR